jgi:uncharacterized membrane protein YhaH (DUF805 family)
MRDGGLSSLASRPEYWWFFLVQALVTLALDSLVRTTDSSGAAIVEFAVLVALLLPSPAVGARRLHDTDRAGWWLLLGLMPARTASGPRPP